MTPSSVHVSKEATVGSHSVSVRKLYGTLARTVGQRAAPASSQQESPRERFARLASHWREETMFLSSLTQIFSHPDYLAIIGMGERALPMIFDELVRGPGLWDAALTAITDVVLATPANAGDIEATTNAWLVWGRVHGYVK